VARQLQARVDELETQDRRRRLRDATNDLDGSDEDDDPHHGRKRRRVGEGSDSDDTNRSHAENGQDRHKEVVKLMARKFALTSNLWLIQSDLFFFGKEYDEDFEEECRFENKEMKVQGQFQDMYKLMPEEVREFIGQPWFRKAVCCLNLNIIFEAHYNMQFVRALKQQLSNTSSRLRNDAPLHIFGPKIYEMMQSSAQRKEEFADLIGYKKAESGDGGYYSTYHVPILHENLSSRWDHRSAFRNAFLIKVSSIYIRLVLTCS
jgi:hypothetical protein